jgi:hypothetical protein
MCYKMFIWRTISNTADQSCYHLANDIMAPSDGATLYLARTRLEYFLLVIYFSDIYIAF